VGATPKLEDATRPVRRISLVVPMLNEAEHITHLVEDMACQDFAGELELLVADGGSTDNSVELLCGAADRCGLRLTVLENPAQWVSHGLNACIRQASGDLIVVLGSHSRYPCNYLSRCALASEETGALVVGGIPVPEGRTPMERSVAIAMDSPFGGIGWMRGTTDAVRRESDVVTFGAFRPETFRLVGLFDESLRRNQDDDFTLRVRRAGGRVVLDSTIRVFYTPRGSLRGAFRQYWEYGLWKVPVIRKHRQISSARSLAPLAFVTTLALLAAVAPKWRVARPLLAAECGAYLVCTLSFAADGVRRRQAPWSLFPRVVAAYPAFHLGYGLGMVRGWLGALTRM
jgi:glycosyltransferase involved in cell wall biosynthesis